MTDIIFYEKPGCINNTKQKKLLQDAGHRVDARSLLTTAWTPEELRPYFGDRPIAEWFNPSAPRIKSGEVDPTGLDEGTALSLMMSDPLLIRRPLICVGSDRDVGFDLEKIQSWIGLNPTETPVGDLETCPRSHQ